MTDIVTNLEANEPLTKQQTVTLPVQLAKDAKALAILRNMTTSDYYAAALNMYNSETLRIITAEQQASLVRIPHPFAHDPHANLKK